jgi:ABC-type glutathione transport system ATPase component
MSLVEVDRLTVEYPGRGRGTRPHVAVSDVTLKLDSGEVLGVIGESGSGKTTLARAVVGLRLPSAGRVLFGGREVAQEDRRALGRRIGMVFQDPRSSVNPRLTIASILRDPLVVHQVGDKQKQLDRCLELLGLVGLPSAVLRRRPRQMSGGQLQRVVIARALALEPELLVADEPTSSLDVSVQAQILNLLEDLRERLGFAMLLISHDMRAIRFLSDRVAVMKDGEVVEQGPVDRIYEQPSHSYTRALIDAVPTLELPDTAVA